MCRPPCRIDPGALAIVSFSLPDLGDALRHRDLEGFRPCGVRKVGNRHARQAAANRPFDIPQTSFFFG